MNDIINRLERLRDSQEWKPEILDLGSVTGTARVQELLNENKIISVSDDFEEQLRELYAYRNPSTVFSPTFDADFSSFLDDLRSSRSLSAQGKWVFYPWRGSLVHVLDSSDFENIRTSRNRNLITEEEQGKFSNAHVGILGLSVGNSIATSIVLQGGANRIRLADFDQLSLSNTNRVRTSIAELGSNKALMTARQIFEMNPYAEIEVFPDGLTQENINGFFDGLDVVIDEIDNLAVKCLVRMQAKTRRIPVLMAADNGDNGVLDIERYDLNPETPFFHGRMGDVSYDTLKSLDKRGIGRMIAKHVGARNIAAKMRLSLPEVGKTIVSWPQLGGAAILNGSAVAYALRRLVCGQTLVDNRALVDLDAMLDPEYLNPESKEKRDHEADQFAKMLGI